MIGVDWVQANLPFPNLRKKYMGKTMEKGTPTQMTSPAPCSPHHRSPNCRGQAPCGAALGPWVLSDQRRDRLPGPAVPPPPPRRCGAGFYLHKDGVAEAPFPDQARHPGRARNSMASPRSSTLSDPHRH